MGYFVVKTLGDKHGYSLLPKLFHSDLTSTVVIFAKEAKLVFFRFKLFVQCQIITGLLSFRF